MLEMFEILDNKGFLKFMRSICPCVKCDDDINYELQKKGANSVPDAMIDGGDFVILEETKLETSFDINQLENHIKMLYEEYSLKKSKVLLTLSIKGMDEDIKDIIDKKIRDNDKKLLKTKSDDKSIVHTDLTFKSLIEMIERSKSNEIKFDYIFDDFKSLCKEEFLLNEREFILNVQTAHKSIKKNEELGLFYLPISRGYTPYKFLGLYEYKNIKYIGEIRCVVNDMNEKSEYKKDKFEFEKIYDDKLKSSESEKDIVIKKIIEAKKHGIEELNYELKFHRYFMVYKFYETSFKKISKQGLRSRKMFDLREYIPCDISEHSAAKDIAEALKNKTWE